ncbi:MAG: cation diffusion facilitator family transporter [Fibrobacterota bacterium]
MNDINRRKTSVALLSIISNACLVGLKLLIGLFIGSVSVMSEAIHSGVDLLAAIIAYFSVRESAKPADKDHPFGHGKVENMSGTIEALLIFMAAVWIIYESVHKLLYPPKDLATPGLGVAVMLLSCIVNIFVSGRLFKVGTETDSMALKADAWHLRTDVYTSLGVMAGLALIWGLETLFPWMNVEWLDPVAAIGVALLIFKAAYTLTKQSSRDLLDVSLPDEEEALIRHHIREFAPTVRGFHRLRTRKAGAQRYVEFHMLVDGRMTVDESHRITDLLRDAIREHYPRTIVTIHIEPCENKCTEECKNDCLLIKKEREQVKTELKEGV